MDRIYVQKSIYIKIFIFINQRVMHNNNTPYYYPKRQSEFSNFPVFTNLQQKSPVNFRNEFNGSAVNKSFTVGQKYTQTNASTKLPQKLDNSSHASQLSFSNSGINFNPKNRVTNQYTSRFESDNFQQSKNYSYQLESSNKGNKNQNQNMIYRNIGPKEYVQREQNKASQRNQMQKNSPKKIQNKLINENSMSKNTSKKDQKEVSWTKYISLQFKVEEQVTHINSLQLQIKNKNEKIIQLNKIISTQNQSLPQINSLNNKIKSLQHNMKIKMERIQALQRLLIESKERQRKQVQAIEKKYQIFLADQKARFQALQRLLIESKERQRKQVQATEKKYQIFLADQKARYIQQTKDKDINIKNLVEKVLDETRKSLSPEINQYITGILAKNNELETSLVHQRQINQTYSRRLKQFQARQHLFEENRRKQVQILDSMAAQLKYVIGKVSSRNQYNTENQCFIHILKTQQSQIRQLRANYDQLQTQFLKFRQSTVETSNKLHHSINQQKSQFSKQKNDLNALISDYATKLTIKQNQYNSLKIKNSVLQRKYNNLINEHKTKFQNIHHLISRKQISIQNLEEIKIAISKTKLQECAKCAQNQKQLQDYRQKLNVFVN